VITDRRALRAVDLGLLLITTFHRLYPEQFALDRVQSLLRHQATLDAVRSGESMAAIRRLWQRDIEAFRYRRAKYLLYD